MILSKVSFHVERTLSNKNGRRRPVREVGAQAAWLHAFEAQSQRAFHLAILDSIVGLVQSSGPSRAVVVDVDDRNVGQAEVIKRTLKCGTSRGIRSVLG